MARDPFRRLTPLEEALSGPVGADPAPDARPVADGDARSTLERSVRAAMTPSAPCYVMFSGGRDSSLVLAVATLVARRDGLPDPVPVTAVYPDDPGADESSWQRLVLDHLGLRERVVVTLHDERTHLGDVALAGLRRHGLVWPAAVQSQPAVLGALPAGSAVLTGEAGDAVVAGTRGTPLYLLLASRRRPPAGLVRAAVGALEPPVLVRARALRSGAVADAAPWLRPAARGALVADLVAARGALRWDAAKRGLLSRRSTALALHNTAAGAAELGLSMHHPLGAPGFVRALAADGGARGYRGRTDVFRRLGADLLPDAILARTSKAWFNGTRWGDRERDFAAGWAGAGVDPELIDTAALRREWAADSPRPAARFLVQVAWLADHRGSGDVGAAEPAGVAPAPGAAHERVRP